MSVFASDAISLVSNESPQEMPDTSTTGPSGMSTRWAAPERVDPDKAQHDTVTCASDVRALVLTCWLGLTSAYCCVGLELCHALPGAVEWRPTLLQV
jgi:hypothetical protein